MISDNDKISGPELGVFIFLASIGIGVLILPSQLALCVDNDAWILALLSGLLTLLFVFIMCKIGERHGALGFVETLKYLFGKVIGTVLAVPVAIYAIFVLAGNLRLFAEVTKLYLLHRTPLEFIILPMIVLVVVLVRMGIEPITRSFGVFIFLIGFVLIILIVVSYQNADLSNLLPIFKKPISKYIIGLPAASFAYAGSEVLLVLFPFIKTPKKAFKASGIAMLFVIGFYVIVTIECITGLGTEETKALIWPVMALTKSISIPGGFIENVEGLLSALWVLFVLTELVVYLYFFSVVTSGIMGHKEHKHFASLSIPLIYLISLQGDSISEVIKITQFVMNSLGVYTIVGLPMLMLIFSYIRGVKK